MEILAFIIGGFIAIFLITALQNLFEINAIEKERSERYARWNAANAAKGITTKWRT